MFTAGAKGWQKSISPGDKLVHTFEAESRFEAFRTYYRLMGFGEWKVPECVPDKFYTGDDQDDFG
jgi:hypothetical protein